MTAYHLRESHDRLMALCIALIDPVLTILSGVWVAEKLRPIADSWMQHHPMHYVAWAVTLYVGFALIASNVTAILVPIAHVFDAGDKYFSESKPRYLAFLIGVGLVIAAHLPAAMQWVTNQDKFPNYDGTIILITVAAFAFVTGIRDFGVRAWHAAGAAATNGRVESRNRRRWNALVGQLVLCGGIAQGIFRARNLAAGAPEKGSVLLYDERSANRGTLVVGAPGSSKTRAKIYPDFYWGLKTSPRAGAIVFITKKHATDDFLAIAHAVRRPDQVHVVGIGGNRKTMDIADGMSHESIGDAIKDGLGESHSEFWKQGPSAFVEGFVELVQTLRPATIRVPAAVDENGNGEPGGDAYDFDLGDMLPTLLDLIALDGRLLDAVFEHAAQRAAELEATDDGAAGTIRTILREVKGRVVPLLRRDPKLAEELRQSALPQLQPFARGPVRRAYCDRNGVDLSLVEKGHVILVEIDEAEYPRAVNTVVRMLFRRLVQMARERTASKRVGSLDPILLMCDEYANYAAAGHVQAWNTIRESNFVATVGLTSLSALVKQVGDQRAADAIVANFSNKFFFDTDDRMARDLANELVGKATVIRHGTSEGTSTTSGTSASGTIGSGGGSNRSRGTSQTQSTTEQREDALDGSIWRSLQPQRESATAIAVVRTDEGTLTDIVSLGIIDPSEGIVTGVPAHYGLE